MPLSQEHISQGRFYNAGVDASTSREIDGMRNILKSLDGGTLPKTIIVGIDPWLFNPNYPPNQENMKNRLAEFIDCHGTLSRAYDAYLFVTARLKGYDLLIREQRNWYTEVFWPTVSNAIGMNAKFFNTGFLADGSFHYPDSYQGDEAKDVRDWERWLANDRYRFVRADEIAPKALEKFKDLLSYCQKRKIEVKGLLLPFRNDFYEAMNTVGTQAAFFRKFRDKVVETMGDFGYVCYDFSSPVTLDLTEQDFIDAHHLKAPSFSKIVDHLFRDEKR
jgi:hypothetical protein